MSSDGAPAAGYSVADLLVTTMAHQIADGDLVAQGIGTHLPTCAYFLAKRTHAPSCTLLYSVGGTISNRVGRLSLTGLERLTLDRPLRRVGYAEIVADTLPSMPFKELSRPAQVDGRGNTNNMVIGAYDAPKVRLPGAGGIPDFSPYDTHDALLYVPRHDRRALVAKLDFRSGIGGLGGEDRSARTALGVTGRGAHWLVSDLCVLGFGAAGAELLSLHDGVAVDEVLDRTGFRLRVPDTVPRTPVPTAGELALLHEMDPHRMRELEFAAASQRIARLREIALLEDGDRSG